MKTDSAQVEPALPVDRSTAELTFEALLRRR
jgi:hypothetical protein